MRRTVIAGCMLAAAARAGAELPLTVEDLLTERGRTRLELSAAYANTERSGLSVGEPIVVQTGPTSFITVPTAIGQGVSNTDSMVATLGLRHGFSARTEGYLRARVSRHASAAPGWRETPPAPTPAWPTRGSE